MSEVDAGVVHLVIGSKGNFLLHRSLSLSWINEQKYKVIVFGYANLHGKGISTEAEADMVNLNIFIIHVCRRIDGNVSRAVCCDNYARHIQQKVKPRKA